MAATTIIENTEYSFFFTDDPTSKSLQEHFPSVTIQPTCTRSGVRLICYKSPKESRVFTPPHTIQDPATVKDPALVKDSLVNFQFKWLGYLGIPFDFPPVAEIFDYLIYDLAKHGHVKWLRPGQYLVSADPDGPRFFYNLTAQSPIWVPSVGSEMIGFDPRLYNSKSEG